MEKKQYIGITIGPIFDTMHLTTSPVALWAASYLFSMLSKTLCEVLNENGVAEEDIVTPFFQREEPLLNKNDGVGLFHDRIIFVAKTFDIVNFNAIKNEAIERVAASFGVDAQYLKEYIMVAAAKFEAENPILESSAILDSLELSKAYVAREEINPILSLFTGDKYSKNNALRGIPVVTALQEFQLKKTEDAFLSLPDIVATGSGYKKYKYYAIVRSDGDNMSKIISGLHNDEQIRDFSKTCLAYCSAVADKVREYNGVTIYSGGDDLLAILPCESRNAMTPFHFIQDANTIFETHFEKYKQPTSLSFGITMAYYKFPLYEALEDSAALLFGMAKKGEKKRIAVRLQKHAGQSEGLIIPNASLKEFLKFFDVVVSSAASAESKDKAFLSAIHKIALFDKAFDSADTPEQVKNLFANIFDAAEHAENGFLHKKLPDFFLTLNSENSILAIDNKGIAEKSPSLTMCYILRMLKFFVEKGGEAK